MHWRSRTAQTTVLLPGWLATRADGWDAGLLPLFVAGADRRAGSSYLAVLPPLFFRWGDARRQRTLLLPLVYDERGPEGSLFLSPLVVSSVDRAAGLRRLVVFPLLWRFTGPDSATTVGFPLYWDFQARRSRVTVLLPFGFHRQAADEATTMILNVLVTRGQGAFAAAWSVHVFPLLELARYHPGHFKWQILLGLLGHERDGARRRFRFVYFWTDPS
jgi:hypothetical protein